MNGTHNTNEDVSTKNLYNYARLVALHYTICNYENGELVEIKKSNIILKPKTINFTDNNGITMEEAIKDGIVLASEKRIAFGNFLVSKTTKKTFPITPKVGATCAGRCADPRTAPHFSGAPRCPHCRRIAASPAKG